MCMHIYYTVYSDSVPHEAYAFRTRQQFALPALLCAWHHAPADELVQQMTRHYKVRRHDGVMDAVLLGALDSDLVACCEVAKYFECPHGSGQRGVDYAGWRDRACKWYCNCS